MGKSAVLRHFRERLEKGDYAYQPMTSPRKLGSLDILDFEPKAKDPVRVITSRGAEMKQANKYFVIGQVMRPVCELLVGKPVDGAFDAIALASCLENEEHKVLLPLLDSLHIKLKNDEELMASIPKTPHRRHRHNASGGGPRGLNQLQGAVVKVDTAGEPPASNPKDVARLCSALLNALIRPKDDDETLCRPLSMGSPGKYSRTLKHASGKSRPISIASPTKNRPISMISPRSSFSAHESPTPSPRPSSGPAPQGSQDSPSKTPPPLPPRASTSPQSAAEDTAARLAKVLPPSQPKLRPILVMIDDLHWSDTDSIEVLYELMKGHLDVSALSFVMATRPESSVPEPLRQTYRQILSLKNTQPVQLQSLSPEGCGDLALKVLSAPHQARLGMDADIILGETLDEMVSNSCGGNPFFIKEICRMLGAATAVKMQQRPGDTYEAVLLQDGTSPGAVREVATSGSAAGPTSSSFNPTVQQKTLIPSRVQDVIRAQIDVLGADLAMVLKVAAVAGESFTGAVLDEVFPFSSLDLKGHLEELCRLQFVNVTRKDDSGDLLSEITEYRFGSTLVLHTAYAMLLHAYRRQLHCSVALALQKRNAKLNPKGKDSTVLISQ
ncbi:unnamed protein product, partial [Chrysoparadoxa australica]